MSDDVREALATAIAGVVGQPPMEWSRRYADGVLASPDVAVMAIEEHAALCGRVEAAEAAAQDRSPADVSPAQTHHQEAERG
jgi:hypothetical protein